MPGATWSDDEVNLLKTLWANGETAHAIAAKLGGMSRSAVLGKIFRLRLPAAASKTPAVQAAAAGGAGEPLNRRRRSFRPAQPPKAREERRAKTLFELTNTCCRWPYRRPGTEMYFFCAAAGADLAGGVPYCARHMKRAYLAPPPRVVEPRRKKSFGSRAKAAGAP